MIILPLPVLLGLPPTRRPPGPDTPGRAGLTCYSPLRALTCYSAGIGQGQPAGAGPLSCQWGGPHVTVTGAP